jgi:hypothetical protein
MFHDFPLQFPEGFQCAGCSMATGIVVQQRDALWQSPRHTHFMELKVMHHWIGRQMMIFSCFAISSTITLLFWLISSLALFSFCEVVAVAGWPESSALVTLTRSFWNISNHSYTILQETALFPYSAHMHWWICPPGTLSAHKKTRHPWCNSQVPLPRSPLHSNPHTNCKISRLALPTNHMTPHNTSTPSHL